MRVVASCHAVRWISAGEGFAGSAAAADVLAADVLAAADGLGAADGLADAALAVAKGPTAAVDGGALALAVGEGVGFAGGCAMDRLAPNNTKTRVSPRATMRFDVLMEPRIRRREPVWGT
jgi:hypothetical protein